MKIISKIQLHPILYLVIIISLFTGLFKKLFIFMSIIFIHELGHVSASLLFKWKIDRIVILPFGGITIFNDKLNRPLIEEFIILVSGPLFQLIYFLIFKDKIPYFNSFNYGLFLFNFLPIYPLDGYKLWNIIFNIFIPYKYSLFISLFISFIFVIFTFKYNLIYIIIYLFLLLGTIKEYKNISNIYNKFLLERYIYKFKFKKIKKITNINNMYKDCYHYINLVNEDYYLEKKFKLTK